MRRLAWLMIPCALVACGGSPDRYPDGSGDASHGDGNLPETADVPQNLDAPGDVPQVLDVSQDVATDMGTASDGTNAADAPDASCAPGDAAPPVGGVLPLADNGSWKSSATCEQCSTTCAGTSCAALPTVADQNRCAALEQCARRGCAINDRVHCYCDSADATTCASAGAHGICAPEFEAAAGTSDAATIIATLKAPLDPTTPIGAAFSHFECAKGICAQSIPDAGIACNGWQPPSPVWMNPSSSCGERRVDTQTEQCDPPRSVQCGTVCRQCDLFCQLAPAPAPPVVCANPLPALAWTIDPPPPEPNRASFLTKLWSAARDDTWLWYWDDGLLSSQKYQHWDGAVWTEMAPPWDSTILPDPLWASGSKDIWYGVAAVRFLGVTTDKFQTGGLLRWDGSKTTTMLSFGVTSIWGLGPNDVWVIDVRRRALHWNGTTWSDRTPAPSAGSVRQIRGAAPNDLWGFDGTAPGLSHWDGSRWTDVSSSDPALLATTVQSVWAAAPNDAWLLGRRCGGAQLWHYDGSRWSIARDVSIPTKSGAGLWGAAGNDVWLWVLSSYSFGYQQLDLNGRLEHFDGTSWSVVDVGALAIDSFSGEGPGRIWATGEVSGKEIPPTTKLFHLHEKCGDSPDGGTDGGVGPAGFRWSAESTTAKYLWAFGPTDVWRSGDDGVVSRWDGKQWNQFLPKNPGDPGAVGKMWASSVDDVWFVNGATIRHWNGTVVEDRTPPSTPSTTDKPVDVFGFSNNDVWAIKRNNNRTPIQDMPTHWDGLTWTDRPVPASIYVSGYPPELTALWGSATNDVWAFSYAMDAGTGATRSGPLFFHWDGQAWSLRDYGSQTLTGPWGGGWNGRLWGGPWNGAWGTSASDVWGAAVTPGQSIFWHFDGSAWKSVYTATGNGGAVWGSGPNDVWGAAAPPPYSRGTGALFHYDGKTFSPVDVGLYWGFTGGVSPSADEVWILGEYFNLPQALIHGQR